MHKESYEIMQRFVEQYLDKEKHLEILDVGSYDVNGSYRPLFQHPNWTYTGLDMAAGPNVDVVSKSAYDFGLDKQFDVVVSGNCLEHVEAPWHWIKEVYKVTRQGGIVCIITPLSIGEHRYPVDCYRILPDGYRYLLERESEFEIIETKVNDVPLRKTYNFPIVRNSSKATCILNVINVFLLRKVAGFNYFPVQDTYAIARKK